VHCHLSTYDLIVDGNNDIVVADPHTVYHVNEICLRSTIDLYIQLTNLPAQLLWQLLLKSYIDVTQYLIYSLANSFVCGKVLGECINYSGKTTKTKK